MINGALAVATQMTCALPAGHPSVDGAPGAQVLTTFKRFIDRPLTMRR